MPNPIVKKAIKTAAKKSSNMKKMASKKAIGNKSGWVNASPGLKAVMVGTAGAAGAAGAGAIYGGYKGVEAINDALKKPTSKEQTSTTKTTTPAKSTAKPAAKPAVTTPKEKPMVKGPFLKKMGGMTKSKKK